MSEIPAHVLSYAPWSVSKAGVIEKCSLQFDYKYGGDKFKELVQFEAAALGVAVHKALELALDGMSVKNALMFAGDEGGLTTDETEQLQTFHDQIVRFVAGQVAFCKQNGVLPQNRMRERKLAMTGDFTHTGWWGKDALFRGVIDYAVLTAKRDLIITDHKSGKEKDLKYFETQCKAYCLMAVANIPNLRGVQTCINFVMTDKQAWNPYVTTEVIRTEYGPWLIDYLTKACTGLLSEPVAKKGWYCDWCGYKPLCPSFGGQGRVAAPKEEANERNTDTNTNNTTGDAATGTTTAPTTGAPELPGVPIT
jgi:hypothetical protein